MSTKKYFIYIIGIYVNMKSRKKLMRSISIIFFVVCLALSSCAPKPTTVPTPQSRPTTTVRPTQTVTPKPTATATPTKIPEVESGKVEENLSNDSFTQLYVMNEEFGIPSINPSNIYYEMYKSHEWVEDGLLIETPQGDTVFISLPKDIGNNLVLIEWFKNQSKAADLIVSKGLLIEYNTFVIGKSVGDTLEKSKNWGSFDSRTGNLVDCTNCDIPIMGVVIGVSPEWLPRQDLGHNTVRKGNRLVPIWMEDLSRFEKLGIESFTYGYEDGEIYRFAPKPYVNPYIEIRYY